MDFRQLRDTDLACERGRANPSDTGVIFSQQTFHGVSLERLTITEDAVAKRIGKPIGTYITLSFPDLFDAGGEVATKRWSRLITHHLSSLLSSRGPHPLLVVGLGNQHLTADSLGTKTAQLVNARSGASPIYVFCPGVEAQSGLNSARAVSAIAREAEAGSVLVIDALCASSPSRLLSTIQLSSCGITPGSGTEQSAPPISEHTLGIPVVSVGVPTVIAVHSCLKALANETGDTLPKTFLDAARSSPLYVCPLDADVGIARAAALLAEAINSLP